jgi:hypothetical protein
VGRRWDASRRARRCVRSFRLCRWGRAAYDVVGDRFMAMLAILAFFVAMFLLNFIEFGRID